MSFKSFLAKFSPSRRDWRRLLESCALDPRLLEQPLEQPRREDFIICGHSRSGTSLLAAALWKPPQVVTVMEPWDCFRMPPAELFRSLREELSTGQLERGRLDLEALERERSVRWQRDGASSNSVEYSEKTLVGVKMPAFWRYLGLLPTTKFLVCVREPVEVIESYRSTSGRLADGFDYDIPFNAEMNRDLATYSRDPLCRQIRMYDYVAERVLPFIHQDNVFTVPYEGWSKDPQGQLDRINAFLGLTTWPIGIDIVSGSDRELDSEIVAEVAAHCRTGRALGYQQVRRSGQAEASRTEEYGA